MDLRVCWMYHDMMDLYGDKGNIKVLRKRCEDRGIVFKLDTLALNEEKDLSGYDLIFIGGGADREQALIYQDLIKRKDNILKAINEKSFILLICGGYQLFGSYYLDQDGHKIEGLSIFDYYTEASTVDGRCIGNIAVECELEGKPIKLVGFENHGGQTKGVKTPLGKVLKGHGNQYQSGFEGFFHPQVIGTYMHGPLLPKNPEMADYIIKKGLAKRGQDTTLEDLDDTLEKKAKNALLKRLEVL